MAIMLLLCYGLRSFSVAAQRARQITVADIGGPKRRSITLTNDLHLHHLFRKYLRLLGIGRLATGVRWYE
jgi:hypothetical protein